MRLILMASLLQHLINALQVLSGIIFNVNSTALASLLIQLRHNLNLSTQKLYQTLFKIMAENIILGRLTLRFLFLIILIFSFFLDKLTDNLQLLAFLQLTSVYCA